MKAVKVPHSKLLKTIVMQKNMSFYVIKYRKNTKFNAQTNTNKWH